MDALIYLVILFIGLLPGLYLLTQYNALVTMRSYIRESWSRLDTELKRRNDFTPSLIEIVREYTPIEHTLQERANALHKKCAVNPGPIKMRSSDEAQLVSILQNLFTIAEACPALKNDERFLDLHRHLVEADNRIQAARRTFNGHIRNYRRKCESFPSSIVAKMFAFQTISSFEAEPIFLKAPSAS